MANPALHCVTAQPLQISRFPRVDAEKKTDTETRVEVNGFAMLLLYIRNTFVHAPIRKSREPGKAGLRGNQTRI